MSPMQKPLRKLIPLEIQIRGMARTTEKLREKAKMLNLQAQKELKGSIAYDLKMIVDAYDMALNQAANLQRDLAVENRRKAGGR